MNRLPAIARLGFGNPIRAVEEELGVAHETLDLGSARCAMVNVWNESHPELSTSLWVNKGISTSNINMRVVSSGCGADEEPAKSRRFMKVEGTVLPSGLRGSEAAGLSLDGTRTSYLAS